MMLPKSKTRLAVQRERARLGMCNLRQRRRVEELPDQLETRPAAERKSNKDEESQEQRENMLALQEIMPKESVPRNHKSNVKIIARHSGTA